MSRKELQVWLIEAYGDTEDCPPPEVWLAEEFGSVPTDRRLQLESHVESCARCAAERRLAAEFDRANTTLEPEEVRELHAVLDEARNGEIVDLANERGSRRTKWPVALAMAASLALAAGLVIHLTQSQPPSLPAPPDNDAVRTTGLELISPKGRVEGVPVAMVWSPIEGADSYSLVVREVDQNLVWERSTSEPRIALPKTIRDRLLPGVTYRWRVEATKHDDSLLARSEAVTFTIEPAQ